MQIDRYTKCVLTAIAAALVVIATQEAIPSASAQFADGCGGRSDPCYVQAEGPFGLSVYVENWP